MKNTKLFSLLVLLLGLAAAASALAQDLPPEPALNFARAQPKGNLATKWGEGRSVLVPPGNGQLIPSN